MTQFFEKQIYGKFFFWDKKSPNCDRILWGGESPHSYVLAIIFLSSLKMCHQLSQNLSRDAHHFGSIKKLKKLKTLVTLPNPTNNT